MMAIAYVNEKTTTYCITYSCWLNSQLIEVWEVDPRQELIFWIDVSFNSVRVNVNEYVKVPLEMRGLFLCTKL